MTYMLHLVLGTPRVRCFAFSCPPIVDERAAELMTAALPGHHFSGAAMVTTIVLHDDVVPRMTPCSLRRLMRDMLQFRRSDILTQLS